MISSALNYQKDCKRMFRRLTNSSMRHHHLQAFIAASALLLWYLLLVLTEKIRHAGERASDHFSVDLTGDPLGMACALRTFSLLHHIAPGQRSFTHPPTSLRWVALRQRLHSGEGLAPWAQIPVQSIGGVWVMDGQTLTTTLSPALPPPPLPPGPWRSIAAKRSAVSAWPPASVNTTQLAEVSVATQG